LATLVGAREHRRFELLAETEERNAEFRRLQDQATPLKELEEERAAKVHSGEWPKELAYPPDSV